MRKPLLGAGDRVGVVSTGFAVRRGLLEAGLKRLRRFGFDVVTGESFYGRNPKFRAPSRLQRAPTTWDRLAASGPVYSGTIAGKRGATSKAAGAAAASPAFSSSRAWRSV